jgi:hypothetical protein
MTEPVFYTETRKQINIALVGCNTREADHCRFMVAEIERLEYRDPLKAARWLGYALRLCEEQTGLPNEVTRKWVRRDVHSG